MPRRRAISSTSLRQSWTPIWAHTITITKRWKACDGSPQTMNLQTCCSCWAMWPCAGCAIKCWYLQWSITCCTCGYTEAHRDEGHDSWKDTGREREEGEEASREGSSQAPGAVSLQPQTSHFLSCSMSWRTLIHASVVSPGSKKRT